MATKWKSFSRSVVTKTIAFLLTIALVCVCAVTVYGGGLNYDLSSAFESSYLESTSLRSKLYDTVQCALTVARYQSEENIRSGKFINQDDMNLYINNLFLDFLYQTYPQEYDRYLYSDGYSNSQQDVREELYQQYYDQFMAKYGITIQNHQTALINQLLYNFVEAQKALDAAEGMVYYVEVDGFAVKSPPEVNADLIRSLPTYLIRDGGIMEGVPTENRHEFSETIFSNDRIYVGMDWPTFDENRMHWETDQATSRKLLLIFGSSAIIVLLLTIYLLSVAGRRKGDEKIHLTVLDRIPFEIYAAIVIVALSFIPEMFYSTRLEFLWIVLPALALISAVVLGCLMPVIKHVKNRTFLSFTLTFRILRWVWRLCRKLYRKISSLMPELAKYIIGIAAYGLLLFLCTLAFGAGGFLVYLILSPVAIFLLAHSIRGISCLSQGLKVIRSGNLNHKIVVQSNGEIREIAEDINSITDGLKAAVANEVKSERMKTELITNVSHDIKTPLTSIITYIDLLKNPDNTPEEVEKYIRVLDEKSQRLKALTEDLFEAAKAASGSIPMDLALVDLVSLVNQALGELDEKLEASGLNIIITPPEEKMLICADGKLLWRVIENLLTNIIKYAMPSSRVYIDISQDGALLRLTMKNISNYALNISPDELMERFGRGDESRSSEGSGLGLAIAKDLTELQGGNFRIEVDGDLFKAIVEFPIAGKSDQKQV